MGRRVPGRSVPVKESIWGEESRVEMVLGRNDPEPLYPSTIVGLIVVLKAGISKTKVEKMVCCL